MNNDLPIQHSEEFDRCNHLAEERTRLVVERTFLSWIHPAEQKFEFRPLEYRNRFLFIWLFLTIFVISPLSATLTPEEMLQEAQISYQQGEKATTYEERKLAFNRALFLYNTLEQNSGSNINDLNQALADTYFQLGEYSWAILYYQKALKNNSSNPLLLSHLEKAQKKLGLLPSLSTDQQSNSFFFISKNFTLFFWLFS